MTEADKKTLTDLLRDLCSAQDYGTHYNELGPGYRRQAQKALTKRDRIRDKILAFVQSKTRGAHNDQR